MNRKKNANFNYTLYVGVEVPFLTDLGGIKVTQAKEHEGVNLTSKLKFKLLMTIPGFWGANRDRETKNGETSVCFLPAFVACRDLYLLFDHRCN